MARCREIARDPDDAVFARQVDDALRRTDAPAAKGVLAFNVLNYGRLKLGAMTLGEEYFKSKTRQPAVTRGLAEITRLGVALGGRSLLM